MKTEDLPFTPHEIRLLNTPEGVARVLWRRYYRAIRLWWRAENARREHEILYGTGDYSKEPVGILNAGGLR